MFDPNATPMFRFIDGLVGNDYGGYEKRIHPYEAIVLKSALRRVPEHLWVGEWSESDLTWLRGEVAEMFEEGVNNAFALHPRLEGLERTLAAGQRDALQIHKDNFSKTFQKLVQPPDSTKMRRSLFLKVVFTLCLITRGRPLISLVQGGDKGPRKVYLVPPPYLRLVSSG